MRKSKRNESKKITFGISKKERKSSYKALLETLQKSQVTISKVSYIFDIIFDSHYSVDTDTEGKTCVLVAVDTSFCKHIGMDHTRTKDLDPACMLTERTSLLLTYRTARIDLKTRLDKRKICRSHPDTCRLSEYSRQK